MDYDKIFSEDNNKKFFFSSYPGKKIIVGKISLNNAIERLSNDEYYVLVTYSKGENLPEQYIPLEGYEGNDDIMFATLNPKINYGYICNNGNIQMISRLSDLDSGSPNYLLGPGPEQVSLENLITEMYNKFYSFEESNENSKIR